MSNALKHLQVVLQSKLTLGGCGNAKAYPDSRLAKRLRTRRSDSHASIPFSAWRLPLDKLGLLVLLYLL